jgi:hypothetical protein
VLVEPQVLPAPVARRADLVAAVRDVVAMDALRGRLLGKATGRVVPCVVLQRRARGDR